jgi:hypothetical protein
MANNSLRIVVHSEAHQPRDYIVGLVLRSVMDYNGIDSRPVHRHSADHVFHQAKTPYQWNGLNAQTKCQKNLHR